MKLFVLVGVSVKRRNTGTWHYLEKRQDSSKLRLVHRCNSRAVLNLEAESRGWDIIGLGQAMVDFSATVEDGFLEQIGVEKGGRRCGSNCFPMFDMAPTFHLALILCFQLSSAHAMMFCTFLAGILIISHL